VVPIGEQLRVLRGERDQYKALYEALMEFINFALHTQSLEKASQMIALYVEKTPKL